MSILKNIDSQFEPVSEQYFIDKKYAYSQYTHKGPMSKYGAWFTTYYLSLNFIENGVNHFPKNQFICLRFAYKTDTKTFIVEPTWSSESYIKTYNYVFEEIQINNPSEIDIEATISDVNLQTRFHKIYDAE